MTTSYTRNQAAGNWSELPDESTPISAPFLEGVETFLDKLTLPSFVSGEGGFQEAIDNTPDGGTVWVDTDTTITVDPTLPAGRSIRVEGMNGARLIQGADVSVMNFDDSTSTTVSISSLTTADVAMTTGDSTTKKVAQFTAASIPAWLTPGARIKVAADDQAPGTNISSGNTIRLGQFVTVHDVTGSVVTLTEIPYQWNAYGTTPRISEAPTSTIQLVNLDIVGGGPAGVAADWSSTLVKLTSYRRVLVRDLSISAATSRGVELQNVDDAAVPNLTVDGAHDDPNNAQYGYGLSLNACRGVRASYGHYSRTRHGVTTNGTYLPSQQSTLARYGRTMDCVISDSISRDSSAAGFDTHTDAYRVHFVNCLSTGAFRGPSGAGSGFQLRGHDVWATNCHATDCTTGFMLSNQATADAGKNFRLIGCSADVEDQAIWVITNGETLPGVEIRGGEYRSRSSSRSIQIDGVAVYAKEVRFVGVSDVASCDLVWLSGAGAELLAEDCYFDIRDVAGAPRLVDYRTAGVSQKAVLVRPTIRCLTTHTLMTAASGDTTATGVIVDAVYTDGEATTKFDADLLNGTTSSTTAYA